MGGVGDWERVVIRILALLLGLSYAAAQEGWITVEATAYCPCALCCDVRTERTANGTNTDQVPYGVAASRNIPTRARVYVPWGIGYLDRLATDHRARWWPVDDRGGALDSEYNRSGITRIDLRFKSHESAKQFGRKLIAVFIITGETK